MKSGTKDFGLHLYAHNSCNRTTNLPKIHCQYYFADLARTGRFV